ncbi:MAG: hypothetical protein V1709_08635 [Planctomycetota bacterium]
MSTMLLRKKPKMTDEIQPANIDEKPESTLKQVLKAAIGSWTMGPGEYIKFREGQNQNKILRKDKIEADEEAQRQYQAELAHRTTRESVEDTRYTEQQKTVKEQAEANRKNKERIAAMRIAGQGLKFLFGGGKQKPGPTVEEKIKGEELTALRESIAPTDEDIEAEMTRQGKKGYDLNARRRIAGELTSKKRISTFNPAKLGKLTDVQKDQNETDRAILKDGTSTPEEKGEARARLLGQNTNKTEIDKGIEAKIDEALKRIGKTRETVSKETIEKLRQAFIKRLKQ